MISLTVEPRRVMTWDEFRAEKPPYSIALDGLVKGPTRLDLSGPYQNLNHHEEVDQAVTKSTCLQVYSKMQLGLFDTFRLDGEKHANVYVNDPDQDTSLAVWLLRYGDKYIGTRHEVRMHSVVALEDMFDTTGGAYPLNPKARKFQELCWMFEPYEKARANGQLRTMDSVQMYGVIDEVGQRITEYVEGRGGRLAPNTEYVTLGGNSDWKIVNEVGVHARSRLRAEGVKTILSVRENTDDTRTVSVVRISPYSTFDNILFYDLCNRDEGISRDNEDRWGGGNVSGGSPRDSGTRLTLEQIERNARESAHAKEQPTLLIPA